MIARHPQRREEGAATVETAITLFLLLLLILGIIEYGIALWQWNTMELAVEQAGRYVMVNNTTCGTACAETQMQQDLQSYVGFTNAMTGCTAPAAGKICVSAATTAGAPSTMTLTATYNFNFIALVGAFTMTSQAKFPID